MSYIVNVLDEKTIQDNITFTDTLGNHECAIFVQSVSYAPQTQFWKKGENILQSKAGNVKKGTAIVMFDGTNYKSSRNKHAAIYISHDANGIWVFDQWNAQGMVKKRYIRKKPVVDITVNNALMYYILD